MSAVRKYSREEKAADPWMTLNKATGELGCSAYTVLRHALAGRIRTQEVAGQTFVDRSDVEKLRAQLEAERAAPTE